MNTLDDIVGYIFQQYPHKQELSKGRITKLIFLSDWLMCVTMQRQISQINWYINKFGPYTEDIDRLLQSNPLFILKETDNYYGGNKKAFFLKDAGEFHDHLPEADRQIILSVIHKTQELSWDKFRKVIYNTYPLSKDAGYEPINLVSLAGAYRKSLAQVKTQANAE